MQPDLPDLSDDDIARVRRGWAAAAADPDRMAAAFYARLFAIAPETRPLFRDDLGVQGRKLTETLDLVVDALDAPERLLPAARDLARRHVAYGVRPDHYDAVGAALLSTLDDLLGGGFSPEDRAAWRRVYGLLSGAMLTEAGTARAPGGADRLQPRAEAQGAASGRSPGDAGPRPDTAR